ncbi:D-alanyl-D-alanine carboxypeptidase [Massilimaliae timonensis]|uniref:serine-type D-Ala-D-Ala carboxypeptidase n=1 Tax=Massiliimalia timonensis TaxID=1987501 RepID=A0A8J6U0P4_9FIRM|nr:D-alanyl-D-alanine carboxypeptidase family protein [Massiliimalia timonensis]MBC8611712.1 D-alanyl-D-alanine carboxypeptidase [Massiliimalia timonensis]
MKKLIKKACLFCMALGIGLAGSVPVVSARSADVYAQSAKAFVLMEAQSGTIILSGNEDVRLPMASTTKIMTALITLEQPELDTYFTVDPEAIRVEGSSMGLTEGDQVSLYALAGGMLLSSGNDAANSAAVRISGSIPEFAELMNQRAEEIGMENTHFVTPSGLHDEEHYSTAYDMALLAKTALENDRFRELCSSPKAKLNFGSPPFDRWLSNHNRLLSYYDGCIGVKTGFTKKAGRCLVSAAERDGVTLICVTLDDPNDWVDHANLFDYGFSLVQETVLKPDTTELAGNVVGGMADEFRVSAPKDAVVHTVGKPGDITEQILMKPFYYAPVQAGEVVGTVRYLSGDKVLAEVPLTVGEDVEQKITEVEKSFSDRIREWFESLLGKST